MRLSKQIKQELTEYLKDRLKHKEHRARIIAPYNLDKSEIQEIQSRVPLIAHAPVDVVVDEDILAGVIIQYGSKRIDLSLRSQINHIFATS